MNRMSRAILLVAVIASQIAMAEDSAPSEEAWQWLQVTGWRAIDSLMPITDTGTALVIFRSYQDLHYEVQEQYFRIDQVYIPSIGLRLTATRVAPVGKSLQEQLLALHVKDSGTAPEALVPRLLVSSKHVDEASCPELRARVDRLDKVRINAPAVNRVAIHPVVRKVIIKAGMGQIDASLYDPNDPLVKWTLATFEALDRCRDAPLEAPMQ